MKAEYFIQVEGKRRLLSGICIPAMAHWFACLERPLNYDELKKEVERGCIEHNISEGELYHYQRMGDIVE